nr:putative bifunctional UDP-N-acetylglucosamine transferase and deubiquitinase ALG13 [Penaeus vannamei]
MSPGIPWRYMMPDKGVFRSSVDTSHVSPHNVQSNHVNHIVGKTGCPDVERRAPPIPSSSTDGLDSHRYIRDGCRFSRQTAPRRWVNMNALTVISVAAFVASSSASLLAYNGVYGGHHGLLGAYPYAGYSGLHPYSYADSSSCTCILQRGSCTCVLQRSSLRTVAPIQSQYHAQDELGQYSFGYAGGPSSRAETRDAFGVVRGSYNYVDSEGKVQTQHYVADALGFRVSGTNLPVAPDAPVAAPLAALPGPLPEPVQDTPEVAAAKAAHQQAYDEAAAAAAAAPDTRKKRSACGSRPRCLLSPPFLIRILHSPPLRPPNSLCFSSSLHCHPPPSPPTTPPTSPPPTPRPLDPPFVTPSSSVWSTTPVTPPPTACSTECHELLHSQSLVWTWCVEHSPRSHL